MAAALLTAACDSNGLSGFTGTVHGQSFSPTEAISNATPVSAGSANTAAVILISNASGSCTDAAADRQPKNTTSMLITLADVNLTTGATAAPIAPGVYTVSPGRALRSAIVVFETTDASCQAISSQSASAASGTVSLNSVSDGAYAGRFDLMMDSSDHVTGTFNAVTCAGISTLFSSDTAPTCF
jgi:hypothetical protein